MAKRKTHRKGGPKPAKPGTPKSHVPLQVLEDRRDRLNAVIKKREQNPKVWK